MTIGDLTYNLNATWEKGSLEKIEQGFKKVSSIFASTVLVASSSLAGMFETTKHFATAQTSLHDLAQENQLSIGSLQALEHAFKSVGLESAKASESIANINQLSKQDFSLIGIKKEDFKSSEALFYGVVDALSKVEDKAQRVELGKKLLGDYDVEKILKGGSKDIKEQKKELQDLGILLTELDYSKTKKFQENLDDFNNTFSSLKSILDVITTKIMVDVMPIFSDLMKRFNNFVKANKELIMTDLKSWVNGLVNGFHFLSELVIRIIGHLGGLENVIIGLGALFAIWQAPLLLTIGAVILVMLAFDDLMNFIEGKESIIGDFVESAKGYLEDFKKEFPLITAVVSNSLDVMMGLFDGFLATVENIYDLLAGNITFSEFLDAQIAILTDFVNVVNSSLQEFVQVFIKAFESIGDYISDFIDSTIKAISDFIDSILNMFSNLDIVGSIKSKIDDATKAISDFTPSFDFEMPSLFSLEDEKKRPKQQADESSILTRALATIGIDISEPTSQKTTENTHQTNNHKTENTHQTNNHKTENTHQTNNHKTENKTVTNHTVNHYNISANIDAKSKNINEIFEELSASSGY